MNHMSLPNSLWTATAAPAADTPALEDERKADAVVVGAGGPTWRCWRRENPAGARRAAPAGR
jgi:hypothetical protein